MTGHEVTCERARRLASLRPDGAGSDLEEAFLTSHLAECATCWAYADAVAASTAAIRATPPIESPAFALLRPRRRIPTRALQTAAAAVILVTAGVSGVSGLQQQQGDNSAPTASQRPAYLDSAGYEQELIEKLTRARVRFHQGSRIAS
jgi:predicted anti-sigma-YlaC factor YlaD